MVNLTSVFDRHRRQAAMIAAMLFATLVCTTLMIARIGYSGKYSHLGLMWNLFLAWLPMGFSLLAWNIYERGSRIGWFLIPACALVWLLFFPNAPYLITDVIHLKPREPIPLWYDVILIMAFAWTGFFLGLVSLLLMHEIVKKAIGRIAGWIFALGALALSAFGIYLGRFLRWNSWDIFTNPGHLMTGIVGQLRHPLAGLRTLGFTALFAVFLISAYLILTSVIGFLSEAEKIDEKKQA